MSLLHKVLIEAVDVEGNVLTAQTVTLTAPGKEARPSGVPKVTSI